MKCGVLQPCRDAQSGTRSVKRLLGGAGREKSCQGYLGQWPRLPLGGPFGPCPCQGGDSLAGGFCHLSPGHQELLSEQISPNPPTRRCVSCCVLFSFCFFEPVKLEVSISCYQAQLCAGLISRPFSLLKSNQGVVFKCWGAALGAGAPWSVGGTWGAAPRRSRPPRPGDTKAVLCEENELRVARLPMPARAVS